MSSGKTLQVYRAIDLGFQVQGVCSGRLRFSFSVQPKFGGLRLGILGKHHRLVGAPVWETPKTPKPPLRTDDA